MTARQILVIEDDAAIREGLADALAHAGYEAIPCSGGNDGGAMGLQFSYDLLLLDLTLPGRDGLDILAELRAARPQMPVIILTARGSEHDRVRGLRLGADDYVVKPFSINELLARIEAVLRRSPERPAEAGEIVFPGGTAWTDRKEIRYDDGTQAALSEREAELLRYLAQRPGQAVSREAILTRVWRIAPENIDTRTIDMHIARLREKLRDPASAPRIIRTVRGKGYVFAVFSSAADHAPHRAPGIDGVSA